MTNEEIDRKCVWPMCSPQECVCLPEWIRQRGPPTAEELAENLHRLAKWCQAKDPNSTIWLHAIEAADALESALTTVSGDMVEEMARAICSKRIGPLEEGSWAILSERGKEAIREEAQAAAIIAKGRIARLTTALEFYAYGIGYTEIEDGGEIARAALKDSPNVG